MTLKRPVVLPPATGPLLDDHLISAGVLVGLALIKVPATPSASAAGGHRPG
jgi:hypothetical protein